MNQHKIESLIDRIKADREFAELQTNSAHNDGYIAGLERAIEILENYDE